MAAVRLRDTATGWLVWQLQQYFIYDLNSFIKISHYWNITFILQQKNSKWQTPLCCIFLQWIDILCFTKKKLHQIYHHFLLMYIICITSNAIFSIHFLFIRGYELWTSHFNISIRWFRRCKLLNLLVAWRVWLLSHLCYFGFIQ